MLTEKMRAELELYMKVESENPETDSLFEAAVQLAESYTGKKFEVAENGPVSPLYWLAVKQTAAHWYDNRGMVSDANQSEIPLSAREILNHICLSGDFPEKE